MLRRQCQNATIEIGRNGNFIFRLNCKACLANLSAIETKFKLSMFEVCNTEKEKSTNMQLHFLLFINEGYSYTV